MVRKTADHGMMECVRCKKEINKTTPNKRYCEDCRKIHDNEYRNFKYQTDENYKNKKIKRIKDWQEKNKQQVLAYQAMFKKKNKLTINARNMARKYVELKKCCEICDSEENLQRHHWRYDKPLLVNTLCSHCHNVQHTKKPMEVLI